MTNAQELLEDVIVDPNDRDPRHRMDYIEVKKNCLISMTFALV